MKQNGKSFLIFLLLLAASGYTIHHFSLLDKYAFWSNQTDSTSTETDVKLESPKKNRKVTPNKKRPKTVNPYYRLDKYAFNTPKSKTTSIGELANYLSSGASNDLEKARLAYSWMAKNINYDDQGYNSGVYSEGTAEGVLSSRRAVCDGYSNLYKALCDSMGLKTVKIIGYAKGYGYTIGDKLTETDHAWNAVLINGEWKLVDVTWGEGFGKTVNNKLKSVKEFDSYWFCTDPYEFLFKHLPENKSEQFISNPITKEQYERLAYVNQGVFGLGISAKAILEKSLRDINYKAPNGWVRDYDIKVEEVELNRVLGSSSEYTFKIKCIEDVDLAFVNAGKWTHFKNENGYFTGVVTPTKGRLTVNASLNGIESSYSTILEYEVE